jgi:hypothetical protein
MLSNGETRRGAWWRGGAFLAGNGTPPRRDARPRALLLVLLLLCGAGAVAAGKAGRHSVTPSSWYKPPLALPPATNPTREEHRGSTRRQWGSIYDNLHLPPGYVEEQSCAELPCSPDTETSW